MVSLLLCEVFRASDSCRIERFDSGSRLVFECSLFRNYFESYYSYTGNVFELKMVSHKCFVLK